MNILFFLTPKSEVAFIYEDYTLRQTLEKMEYHKYSSIPILTRDGKYVGTITEGDLLWTLFFLTPKSEVAFIYEDYTLRQTLEKMEYHKYSSIPILTRDGKYVGTITEGDLLWTLKDNFQEKTLDFKALEDMPISMIKRRKDNAPVSVEANIEDLISKARNQNFVPVIDDHKTFIGMIKRKEIIEYCYDKIHKSVKI